MKARIKATGQIIELNDENLSLLDYARGIYRDTEGNKFHYNELEFIENKDEKPIDWEARKFELVKTAMKAILSDPECEITTDELANSCVSVADAIIEKMKGGEK